MPVPDIVAAINAGRDLPPRTIGITFDGGYASAMKNGAPILLRAGLPFTVFIAANDMDTDSAISLAPWRTFKMMAKKHKALVSFGILPALNTHMGALNDADIMTRLNTGRMIIKKHIKRHVTLAAYPFGVYDDTLHGAMQTQGFSGVFGAHSGAVHSDSDMFALPRFTMSENYSDLARFTLTANALPLPAADIEPAFSYGADTGNIGFTLARGLRGENTDANTETDINTARLSCFISGQAQPRVNILGTARVEIRPRRPITAARTRINCTILEHTQNADGVDQKRWRWFGMLLVRD